MLPAEAVLYAHDWKKTRELLKKAASLDLLRLEIPEALQRSPTSWARRCRCSAATATRASSPVERAYRDARITHAANIVIESYAIESAIGRADKMFAAGSDRAPIAQDIARVYASDAVDRAAHAGKQIVNAITGSERLEHLADAVARVASDPGIDTVAARRRIGDAAIAATRYPF